MQQQERPEQQQQAQGQQLRFQEEGEVEGEEVGLEAAERGEVKRDTAPPILLGRTLLPTAQGKAPAPHLEQHLAPRTPSTSHKQQLPGGHLASSRVAALVTVGAVPCMLLLVGAGVVLQLALGSGSGVSAGGGGPPALGHAARWDLASPQWLFGVVAVAALLLRRHLLPWAAGRWFGHLQAAQQTKVASYMLELLGTTAALALCGHAGFFRLLPWLGDGWQPDAQQVARLAAGVQETYAAILVVHLSGLSFDPELRLGLRVHHWTCIAYCTWAVLALRVLDNHVAVLRGFFTVLLFMATPQNVFVSLLLYLRRVYWPRLYYASAWYHFASRAAIGVLSVRAWLQMEEVVFAHNLGSSWLAYSFWLASPFMILLLLGCEVTVLQRLFSIALSAGQQCAEMQKERHLKAELRSCAQLASDGRSERSLSRPSSRHVRHAAKLVSGRLQDAQGRRQLVEAFQQIDFEHRGHLLPEAWARYVDGIWREEWLLPRSAFEEVFGSLEEFAEESAVTVEVFVGFFGPCMMGSADFGLVLLAKVLQRVHATPGIDMFFRALLERKHEAVMAQLTEQYHERCAANESAPDLPRTASRGSVTSSHSRASRSSAGSWASLSSGTSEQVTGYGRPARAGHAGAAGSVPATSGQAAKVQDEDERVICAVRNLALLEAPPARTQVTRKTWSAGFAAPSSSSPRSKPSARSRLSAGLFKALPWLN